MTTEFNNFRKKTLRQIRIWAWLAAVLPITALSGIFFIWTYGTRTWFDIAVITGETTMFGVAVIWWWWAIYVINKLVYQWEVTRTRVDEVLTDVKEIKGIVRDVIPQDSDK